MSFYIKKSRGRVARNLARFMKAMKEDEAVAKVLQLSK